VPGWRYKWGDKLHADDLAGMPGVSAKQARNLQGLVNFRYPGGAGNPAAESHSRFVSFRTMVEGSKGWRAPRRTRYGRSLRRRLALPWEQTSRRSYPGNKRLGHHQHPSPRRQPEGARW
jgi:hypothetical protein